jgi:YVTN family beta-propeller protein
MHKTTLVVLALAALNSAEAQTPQQTLLALSKHDHTVAIVDPATLKVIAKAPVGNDPHEVIASTDGKTAYVSNYGGGAYNTLAVIDLVSQKALPSIDLGALKGPHGLDFIGGKVWFTVEGSKAFGSYDPSSQKIDFILGTGQNRTHMIYVFDDLKHIVATNVSSGTVTMIEKLPPRTGGGPPGPPGGDWDETVVKVGNGSEGFDVSPNHKEIWVANAQEGTISIIDVASKKVVETLNANVQSANRLKFTPDGAHVFVSGLRMDHVAVFDAATRKDIKDVKIGRGAAGIQMQPDGSLAYVAATPDNYVAVIDLKTLEVVGKIDVGVEPDGLAWAIRR